MLESLASCLSTEDDRTNDFDGDSPPSGPLYPFEDFIISSYPEPSRSALFEYIRPDLSSAGPVIFPSQCIQAQNALSWSTLNELEAWNALSFPQSDLIERRMSPRDRTFLERQSTPDLLSWSESLSESVFEGQESSPREGGDARDQAPHKCLQCNAVFSRVFELEEHAKKKGHKLFECKQCFKKFSRRDAWRRHTNLHSSQTRHECVKCDKYRGGRAFKRRDHLLKHLRTVHQDDGFPRLCPHIRCKLSAANPHFKQFDRRKDYSRHMQEDHGGDADNCSVPGCRKFNRGKSVLRLQEENRQPSPPSDGELLIQKL